MVKFPGMEVLENDFGPWKSWKLYLAVWRTGKAPLQPLLAVWRHINVLLLLLLLLIEYSGLYALNTFLQAYCMHIIRSDSSFLCFVVV